MKNRHHRPMGGSPSAQAGFTLLEVLVAMSVLAGLTAMLWVAVNNMFETRDYVTKRYERYQIMRVAMDRMNTEIAAAYVAGPSHGAEDLFNEDGTPKNKEEAERKLAEGQREPVEFGMKGDESKLNFTTFAHMRTVQGEKNSHHAEIGYEIKRIDKDNEPGTVKALVRRIDTTFDDDITRGGKVYVLIPEIKDVEFDYWDSGEVQLGSEKELGNGRWVDSWDTSQRIHHDRLPTRVRITVTLPAQGPRSKAETFTTQTQIMTSEILEF